ncbi:MAG: hypothetical protein CMB46_02480 [Euryarchaeota archaeon]|jgi:hypothetical protein|nr:hypothetical protein [Euryarchaeota archaeon]
MRLVASLLVCVLLALPINCAGESGVNEETSIEGTDIRDISYPDEASAGDSFELTVVLSDEASENGTTVSWVTQVCINSGVCYPPETHSMALDEEGVAWGAIVPDDTVTYVNWRVEMNWEDGNTTSVPETGFGWKVWSDCWYDNEEWGGSDQECVDNRGSDSDRLPGFGVAASLMAVLTAGLMGRRD